MGEPDGFTVIPAVDIKGGRCVRLWRGLAEKETVFDEDPVRAALRWEFEGAQMLHVVDLDGAFAGAQVNAAPIKKIARTLQIPIEVGGGIRTTAAALDYTEAGVSRVVVGTAAFKEPEWLEGLAAELGERLIVGVDVKEGRVAVHGWMGVSEEEPTAAVRRLADAGVRRIIYTDTTKDGTLEGPNFKGIEAIAAASPVPVIASGGVGTVADIVRVADMGSDRIEGVIVGMALYRGEFTLGDALAVLRERSG
jgi:phosphoribosylformimino-5-aminoimidazole carboxamide ribotide isomerase